MIITTAHNHKILTYCKWSNQKLAGSQHLGQRWLRRNKRTTSKVWHRGYVWFNLTTRRAVILRDKPRGRIRLCVQNTMIKFHTHHGLLPVSRIKENTGRPWMQYRNMLWGLSRLRKDVQDARSFYDRADWRTRDAGKNTLLRPIIKRIRYERTTYSKRLF